MYQGIYRDPVVLPLVAILWRSVVRWLNAVRNLVKQRVSAFFTVLAYERLQPSTTNSTKARDWASDRSQVPDAGCQNAPIVVVADGNCRLGLLGSAELPVPVHLVTRLCVWMRSINHHRLHVNQMGRTP